MITSKTAITVTLDWYAYTCDTPLYHPKSTMNCVELDRGLMGYTNGVKFIDGRLELINPDQPAMRTHIIYSGSALASGLTFYGVTPYEIISLDAPGGKATRIDVAIDIRGGTLDITALSKLVEKNRHISTATKALHISSPGQKGETLYIGASTAKLRLRIYDKAAEQNIDEQWTRIELVIRGKRARKMRETLIAGGEGMESIPPTIRGFCDFPDNVDWALAVGCKSLGLSAPNRSETDTRKWLMTTVIPSLAREIAMDGTGKFERDFLTTLSGQIGEEKKKIRAH